MKASLRMDSFASGELSKRALGRTDLPEYHSGMRALPNWIVQPTGSATRRPGFKYCVTAKTISFPSAALQSSGTGNFDLTAVCYAQQIGTFGRLVAVGKTQGAHPLILFSDDKGVTWTAATTIPAENFNLYGVCWSGSLFVAVGAAGADATLFTSPDGITWTTRVSGGAAQDLNAVIWTGTRFVAVGGNGSCRRSTDGITWGAGTGMTITLKAITQNSTTLVATTLAGTVGYSVDDGATWNPINATGSAIVFWNNDYYTAGASGTKAQISRNHLPTGIPVVVFTSATNTTTLRGLAIVGSYLVAVGDSGEFVYTLDGTTWHETTIGTVAFTALCAGPSGNPVMVGASNGANAIIYTTSTNTYQRKLYPFTGSTGLPYLMEFGHLYVRFLRPDSTGLLSYVQSSPGVPLEIVTVYQASDLPLLQFAQANDVLYIAHPSYPPRRLTRTSETAFTLVNMMDSSSVAVNPFSSTYKFIDGPYLDENGTVTTLKVNTIGTGSKTMTASASLFTSADIGRIVRLRDAAAGNLWGWGVITAFASATSVTIFMVEDPASANTTVRWALGAWGTTPGFPAAVTFFQQRLCWGGSAAEPMGVKCSTTAAFETYAPTQLDDTAVADNAVYFTVGSKRMSPIVFLAGELALAVGTQAGVYFADGGASGSAAFGAPITPGGVYVRKSSSYGAEPTVPATVGDLIVFIQKGGRLVRALSPGSSANTYAQPNLTQWADQATISGLVEIVFAGTPSAIVWGRRTDGTLVGLTLDPSSKVMAWHPHPLPGSLSGPSGPLVMSVAVLPIYGHDQLFIAVRRTINGSEVEFIEALQLPFDSDTDALSGAWYLDAAVQYSGPATTAVTGLDHLEGQTVEVFGDGVQQASKTVSSGAITIDTAASVVLCGLGYDTLSQIETMPARLPTRTLLTGVESGDGAIVNINAAVIEMVETAGLLVGAGGGPALDPAVDYVKDDNGVSITGTLTTDFVLKAPVGGNSARLATMILQPVGPYPSTLTGLAMFVDGNNPNG